MTTVHSCPGCDLEAAATAYSEALEELREIAGRAGLTIGEVNELIARYSGETADV